jgi:hypothetical protein
MESGCQNSANRRLGIRQSSVGHSVGWESKSLNRLGHSIGNPARSFVCPFVVRSPNRSESVNSFYGRSIVRNPFVHRSFGNPVRSGKKKDGRKFPPSSQYAKMRDALTPRTFAGYSFIHLCAHFT